MPSQENEMIALLKDIRDKINLNVNATAISAAAIRGPVADPGPDWAHVLNRRPIFERIPNIAGPIADPGPELLLDKSRLAKLKVGRLEDVISGLEKQIEAFRLEQSLLKEEYKIK